jgi:hypothetical protein
MSSITILEAPVIPGISSEVLAQLVGLEVGLFSPAKIVHVGRKPPTIKNAEDDGYCLLVAKICNTARFAGKIEVDEKLSKTFEIDSVIVFPADMVQYNP